MVGGQSEQLPIAYPGFGRLECDAGQRRCAALLVVHPVLEDKRKEGTRVQTLFIRFFGYGELEIEIFFEILFRYFY